MPSDAGSELIRVQWVHQHPSIFYLVWVLPSTHLIIDGSVERGGAKIFHTERAEAILDTISNNINKTYIGLISVLQGFQKCIA